MFGNQQDKSSEALKATDALQQRDELINNIALAAIKEQRRARRWGIFWKSLSFIYLTVFLLSIIGLVSRGGGFDSATDAAEGDDKHTAIVDVNGVILNSADANADTIIRGLQRAFEHKNTAGVVVRINSPGGSPVQASQIFDEMQRLREQYPDIPLHAVIEDMGASGGYYVAAGAQNIYANASSLVGSIGVIMNNFGFVDAMEKLGIERRTLTAGESKALADPFLPLDQATADHLQTMLGEVHQHFIDAVKQGRGERLANDDSLFTGLIWTAETAIELGLIDALADVRQVARDEIGAEKMLNFTPKRDILENFTNQLGISVSNNFINKIMQLQFR